MSDRPAFLFTVSNYYRSKLEEFGPQARGVDWNSEESQILRFRQLLKIIQGREHFSINDYGCGYGALFSYLKKRYPSFDYVGFDICLPMLEAARKRCAAFDNCSFTSDETQVAPADYTVASGLFNVKLDIDRGEWEAYVLRTMQRVHSLSEKGFAVNFLTVYSDPERMRTDLYYADPLFMFDYCKRHFSRRVALLHDYPLYEFTILVRK